MMPTTHALANLLATGSWWVVGLLMLGLALHIVGASVAILSGYAAVAVKKGARWHRAAGKAFVVSMLVMTAAAVALAVPLQERSNIAGGVLAAYLVVTAWLAVKRPPGAIGMAEKVAFLAIIGVTVAMSSWAVLAYASPKHALDGYSWVFYAVFGAIAAALAVADLRLIRRGGLTASERIRRHLWRMCFAFFFAAASFFLGQQKVMPAWMHGSPVLWVLGLAPLGFMAYWLFRTRRRARRAIASGAPA